jgi:hypothetical protein
MRYSKSMLELAIPENLFSLIRNLLRRTRR